MLDPVAGRIVEFVRVLRLSGVPVGGDAAPRAIRIAAAVNAEHRGELYWGLHAGLISDREHHELFERAFNAFFFGSAAPPLMPEPNVHVPPGPPPPGARRVAEVLRPGTAPARRAEDELIPLSASDFEALKKKDFEQMTGAETRAAEKMIRQAKLFTRARPTRRYRRTSLGAEIDVRASLRQLLRGSGEMVRLQRRSRVRKPPPVVVVCDISGSMSSYSRMFLHLAYAIGAAGLRCSTFVFGTRLSHVSRQLKSRDVDAALQRVADRVKDFDGGTRIASGLKAFNQHWARRVLGQGATVLLLTDGLEREGGSAQLEREVIRLRLTARRVVWLNPLLRFAEYQPLASGARILARHLQERRPAHNLESLLDLQEVLGD